MTVRELIAELQKLDGELDVVVGRETFAEAAQILTIVSGMYWARDPYGMPGEGYVYESKCDCDDGELVPVVVIDPRR